VRRWRKSKSKIHRQIGMAVHEMLLIFKAKIKSIGGMIIFATHVAPVPSFKDSERMDVTVSIESIPERPSTSRPSTRSCQYLPCGQMISSRHAWVRPAD
jgi:hypothetical protein